MLGINDDDAADDITCLLLKHYSACFTRFSITQFIKGVVCSVPTLASFMFEFSVVTDSFVLLLIIIHN